MVNNIRIVMDVNDFERALRAFSYCDIILIDTMGSSQYDRAKLEKIYEFIKGTSFEIDVSLVLSVVAKIEDLYEIYENFSIFDIDTLIFTKLDETKHFGNIFSIVYKTNKPISYLSIGQEVPDDLVVAKSEYIVDWMLNGFDKKKVIENAKSGK